MNKKILRSLKPIYYKPIYNFGTDLIYNYNSAYCKLGLRFTNFNKLEVIIYFYDNRNIKNYQL